MDATREGKRGRAIKVRADPEGSRDRGNARERKILFGRENHGGTRLRTPSKRGSERLQAGLKG
jgi:hypothetical protein